MRRKALLRWGAVAAATLLAAVLAIALLNPRITAAIESPGFRAELDKQTSKGLHFTGSYGAIRRTGILSAESPAFQAGAGSKAMKSLSAERISASFNPLGLLLRRWQLDSITIETGRAEIQTYEPKPSLKPDRPWYAVFLPDRVYLKEVICKEADIVWHFRNKEAGFRGARLVVTPHGRDFAYHASGGTFAMAPAPRMKLDAAHVVITKELLMVHQLQFLDGEEGRISVTGQAGMKSDKSIRAQAAFTHVPIGRWIPQSWGEQVVGLADGAVLWEGTDQTVESSCGSGELRITGATLAGIPLLDYAASAARKASLESLKISRCEVRFEWKYPRLSANHIAIEAVGEFIITGTVELNRGKLSGTLEFGTAAKNLDWIPKAKDKIFTRSRDGYLWTTVRLSGTFREPENDLTPRIAEVLSQSPGVSTGLFFRQIGEWFDQTFTGD